MCLTLAKDILSVWFTSITTNAQLSVAATFVDSKRIVCNTVDSTLLGVGPAIISLNTSSISSSDSVVLFRLVFHDLKKKIQFHFLKVLFVSC